MKETRRVENYECWDGEPKEYYKEVEYASLNSVEIGQTAKGEWQIKSIKVYGNDLDPMVTEAEKLLHDLMGRLQGLGMVGE